MKTIVVSAVNLKVGGTLTILRDCLHYLSSLAEGGDYRIVALVYQKELADYPNIEYIELRWPKKNWVNRLWCEYVTMKGISRQLSPVYLWLSLHDTTPTVIAERRAVYCHNSFPFYTWKLREIFFTPKVVGFALFSKYAYRKGIRQNRYVIVQQQWIKDKFVKIFHLRKEDVIVAPPTAKPLAVAEIKTTCPSSVYHFFYAAAPDSHKNFECICQAAKIVEEELGKDRFKVHITITGNENAYTRWLYRRWGKSVDSLCFTGYLDKSTLYEYYSNVHCLLFPSKVETWGLPITEFSTFKKPMLLADLPYARETAGGCEQVSFFHPDSPSELAGRMKWLIRGNISFLKPVERKRITSPQASSWNELFQLLLEESNGNQLT